MNNNNNPQKKKKIIPAETKLQAQCFEIYYSLGDNRNLTALSKRVKEAKLKVDYQVLRAWKIKQYWEARIIERDYYQIKAARIQSNFDMTEIKKDYANALRNSISTAYETKDGKRKFKIVIATLDQLERAVKLLLLLGGEPTDIHSVRVEVVHSIINNVVMIIGDHVKDPKLLSAIAAELQVSTMEITSGD